MRWQRMLVLVGVAFFVAGIRSWIEEGALRLWASLVTILGFTFLVIGVEEIVHVRGCRHCARKGAPRVAVRASRGKLRRVA
jgi:hypothetical protein